MKVFYSLIICLIILPLSSCKQQPKGSQKPDVGRLAKQGQCLNIPQVDESENKVNDYFRTRKELDLFKAELTLNPDLTLNNTALWSEEMQQVEGNVIAYSDEKMIINVSQGATVWLKERIEGDCIIDYDVTIIDQGGANDRVSDMNCFWMFTDPFQPAGSLQFDNNSREGEFGNYHTLQGYYVGLGGHNNTKTRFRRYNGDEERKLLPEHDLTAPLITANKKYNVTLVAKGNQVQYWRDNHLIFNIDDPTPYISGWFGFRTVANHMEIENFRVFTVK